MVIGAAARGASSPLGEDVVIALADDDVGYGAMRRLAG